MLPSWMRSRNWRPRLLYFLAMETTSRRLAATSSFLAWSLIFLPVVMARTILPQGFRVEPDLRLVCSGAPG